MHERKYIRQDSPRKLEDEKEEKTPTETMEILTTEDKSSKIRMTYTHIPEDKKTEIT